MLRPENRDGTRKVRRPLAHAQRPSLVSMARQGRLKEGNSTVHSFLSSSLPTPPDARKKASFGHLRDLCRFCFHAKRCCGGGKEASATFHFVQGFDFCLMSHGIFGDFWGGGVQETD